MSRSYRPEREPDFSVICLSETYQFWIPERLQHNTHNNTTYKIRILGTKIVYVPPHLDEYIEYNISIKDEIYDKYINYLADKAIEEILTDCI